MHISLRCKCQKRYFIQILVSSVEKLNSPISVSFWFSQKGLSFTISWWMVSSSLIAHSAVLRRRVPSYSTAGISCWVAEVWCQGDVQPSLTHIYRWCIVKCEEADNAGIWCSLGSMSPLHLVVLHSSLSTQAQCIICICISIYVCTYAGRIV